MDSKECFKCHVTQPLSAFYDHPRMADGHLNKCRECTKRDVHARYTSPSGRKKVLRYERERHQTPERKAAKRQYDELYRERHPERKHAHQTVNNAIRSGKLTRQPCEVCGAKSQAHHDDYSKPLDVRWLCFRCHREHAHGQIVGPVKHQTPALPF